MLEWKSGNITNCSPRPRQNWFIMEINKSHSQSLIVSISEEFIDAKMTIIHTQKIQCQYTHYSHYAGHKLLPLSKNYLLQHCPLATILNQISKHTGLDLHEFFRCAEFNRPSGIHDEYLIEIGDRTESMRNHQ